MRTPLDGEQFRQMDQTVMESIHSTVIPLFVENDDSAIMHGTGTLLGIAGARFVVTAAHVITQAQDANLKLYFGYGVKERRSLGLAAGEAVWIGDDKDAADVAAWRLPDEHALLFSDHRCVRLLEIDRPPFDRRSFYCVAGFPTSFNEPLRRGGDAARMIDAIKLYTSLHDGDAGSLENYNSKLHVLLQGRTESMRQEADNDRPFPEKLNGISGGQIWRVTCNKVGEAMRTQVALHAIQTSVYRSGRLIRGTRWANLLGLLAARWPEFKPAMTLELPFGG